MGEIPAAPQVWSGRLRGQESEDSDFKKSQDKATGTIRESELSFRDPELGRSNIHGPAEGSCQIKRESAYM